MKLKEESFYEFLLKQKDRDDPVGDLANDLQRENDAGRVRNALKESSDFNRWKSYLLSHRAYSGAIEALEQVWEEYVLTF